MRRPPTEYRPVKDVVTAILGGGQGLRLWPLTVYRAKPAVPVGGKFRLIDIPISNSLHAGIDRIYVMTQFLSASLHRHIAQTYRFDVFSNGFVNILAAEQGLRDRTWYQGTADAVRQNLDRITEAQPRDVLILSGDQLYIMELRRFIERHRDCEADFTVAVKPVTAREARGLGVMRIEPDGRIVEFVEKPQDPAVIARLALDQASIDRLGIDAEPGMVLASMGIYTFRSGILRRLLDDSNAMDFGKEIIPGAIGSHRVYSFIHTGYWRDIGTIETFHQANLELTSPLPSLNLYDPDYPIYTHPRFLPGAKISQCEVTRSIVCDGCIISNCKVKDSIIGVRAVLQAGSTIETSYIMGATSFERSLHDDGQVLRTIGPRCHVRRAIIDLDARIGADSKLLNEAGVQHADGEHHCIRDGVIVVPRGAVIPPGTVI